MSVPMVQPTASRCVTTDWGHSYAAVGVGSPWTATMKHVPVSPLLVKCAFLEHCDERKSTFIALTKITINN